MHITDKIYNVQWYDFDKPLELEKMKKYDDIFALAVLRYCYPEIYNHFIKDESPDLQKDDRTQGVEVTSARNEIIASIDGNFANYRLTDNSAKQARLKTKIKKAGAKLDSIGILYPKVTEQQEIEAIEQSIQKKISKLSNYQKKGFTKMELLVRCPSPPCILNKDIYIELMSKAKGYDTVYLTTPSCLMVYHHVDKYLSIKKIPEKDYIALEAIARLTVDGKIKPDNSIWETPVYNENN